LNQNTVSKFSTLKSFRESLNRKKTLDRFYKSGLSLLQSSRMTSRRQSGTQETPEPTEGIDAPASINLEEKAIASNLLN
jgi:hypothetical protein